MVDTASSPIPALGGAALEGLKVVEFAHVIAGPLAGTLLADLGAEVIHVDDPEHGDPGRKMGPPKDGTYLWWKVAARNKRSVTIDLRTPDGQEVARELVRWADVVITNFRVNTLAKWGLDWESRPRREPDGDLPPGHRVRCQVVTGQHAGVRQGRRGARAVSST